MDAGMLGAMPNVPFEERTMTIKTGDTLFIYTDGLTDRQNANGDFYSIDRIARLLEKSDGADLGIVYDGIRDDITAFGATEEFRDDIAFVLTRFV